jgi:hypothetical protein
MLCTRGTSRFLQIEGTGRPTSLSTRRLLSVRTRTRSGAVVDDWRSSGRTALARKTTNLHGGDCCGAVGESRPRRARGGGSGGRTSSASTAAPRTRTGSPSTPSGGVGPATGGCVAGRSRAAGERAWLGDGAPKDGGPRGSPEDRCASTRASGVQRQTGLVRIEYLVLKYSFFKLANKDRILGSQVLKYEP